MKFLIIGILITCASYSASCQIFNAEDWCGNYSGKMLLSSGYTGEQIEIDVAFEFKEIVKDSSWTYIMTYTDEKNDKLTKTYRIIKPENSPVSKFILDELDGTLIDMSYRNKSFLSFFEVEGMFHSSSLSLINKNTLRFEIYGSFSREPSRVTEAMMYEESETKGTLTVASFCPAYSQTVFLKRKRK
jgi:hypothetical protein